MVATSDEDDIDECYDKAEQHAIAKFRERHRNADLML